MRTVLFKKYIKPIYGKLGSTNITPANIMDGSGIWLEDVPGKFHQWAAAFEDYGEQGPGNYTVALVEELNGNIVEVHPTHIQFIP